MSKLVVDFINSLIDLAKKQDGFISITDLNILKKHAEDKYE